ncbi:hypothetical protein G9A89_000703 [Geosiphon pyriformis]|nr:hypothetical protein G9A89_000703 [Geosiphon pyriformis]
MGSMECVVVLGMVGWDMVWLPLALGSRGIVEIAPIGIGVLGSWYWRQPMGWYVCDSMASKVWVCGVWDRGLGYLGWVVLLGKYVGSSRLMDHLCGGMGPFGYCVMCVGSRSGRAYGPVWGGLGLGIVVAFGTCGGDIVEYGGAFCTYCVGIEILWVILCHVGSMWIVVWWMWIGIAWMVGFVGSMVVVLKFVYVVFPYTMRMTTLSDLVGYHTKYNYEQKTLWLRHAYSKIYTWDPMVWSDGGVVDGAFGLWFYGTQGSTSGSCTLCCPQMEFVVPDLSRGSHVKASLGLMGWVGLVVIGYQLNLTVGRGHPLLGLGVVVFAFVMVVGFLVPRIGTVHMGVTSLVVLGTLGEWDEFECLMGAMYGGPGGFSGGSLWWYLWSQMSFWALVSSVDLITHHFRLCIGPY